MRSNDAVAETLHRVLGHGLKKLLRKERNELGHTRLALFLGLRHRLQETIQNSMKGSRSSMKQSLSGSVAG